MTESGTSLDTRFSEPGFAATPWETTLQVLRPPSLSWITAVRYDSRPHLASTRPSNPAEARSKALAAGPGRDGG
jgi:hypothetical protein